MYKTHVDGLPAVPGPSISHPRAGSTKDNLMMVSKSKKEQIQLGKCLLKSLLVSHFPQLNHKAHG